MGEHAIAIRNNKKRRLKKEMVEIIKVDGYKAFRGKMKISPKNSMQPFVIESDWLYKPEYDCWYGNCSSYPASICEVVEE